MLHAPPVSLLPWCPCRAFFAARLPLLKRPVPPWLAPRHRRVLRRCYLVSSPIITSDVAPSFAASSTHLRCVVTAAACFSKLRRRPPVFDGPDRALAALGYQRPPLRASFHAFFIFTSRPPSPFQGQGFASVCIAPLAAPCTPSLCRNINIFAAFFLSLPRGCGRAILRVVGEGPDVNLNRRGAASSISSSS